MKSDESKSSKGLEGDPRRRANAAVREFIYQFWRTVEAWIELDPEELLFIEGAEDFDIVGLGGSPAGKRSLIASRC